MVKGSRGKGLRGNVSYTEALGPQSIAILLGLPSKGTPWFALQKNGTGSSRVCDGRRATGGRKVN